MGELFPKHFKHYKVSLDVYRGLNGNVVYEIRSSGLRNHWFCGVEASFELVLVLLVSLRFYVILRFCNFTCKSSNLFCHPTFIYVFDFLKITTSAPAVNSVSGKRLLWFQKWMFQRDQVQLYLVLL